MSDPQIVEALPWHCLALADRLRPADVAEIKASSGASPREALEFSRSRSTFCRTIMLDDVPQAMFGAATLNVLTLTGAPWLLGSDMIETRYRWFLRHSHEWRDQLLRRYAVLRNLVDDRNTMSIRWLKWMGFTFSDPVPWGVEDRPFRLFELRRGDV